MPICSLCEREANGFFHDACVEEMLGRKRAGKCVKCGEYDIESTLRCAGCLAEDKSGRIAPYVGYPQEGT